MWSFDGWAIKYEQNWVQGEKSDLDGSVIGNPLLSLLRTGVPKAEGKK